MSTRGGAVPLCDLQGQYRELQAEIEARLKAVLASGQVILGPEVAALEAEVATLSDRLETRKAVERAKGTLMTQYAMTEPQAFKWIQRTAMDHRLTMREVAERIVEEAAEAEAGAAED